MSACDTENLGLTDAELAGLTGFTTPMVLMLAHLRQAWLRADPGNAEALAAGVRAMMEGHSFARNRRIVAKVLTAGLDERQRRELLGKAWALEAPR